MPLPVQLGFAFSSGVCVRSLVALSSRACSSQRSRHSPCRGLTGRSTGRAGTQFVSRVRRRGPPVSLIRWASQMRLHLSIALFALSTFAPIIGYSQSMTSSSTQRTEELRVLAAEDEYVAAEVSRDETALRRLVDDRFQYNTSRGTTTGKEELIASLLKMSMVGQTIKERSVLVEGSVALVFGTAEIRFASPGKPETTSTLRYTATYVDRQGQWRMLALQMQQRAPQ